MMALTPQKARMFNSGGIIPKLRCMKDGIESLMRETTFACQSGTCQPSRCDINLLEVSSKKSADAWHNEPGDSLRDLHSRSPQPQRVLFVR